MKGFKSPQLKVPPALADLFYDLRDRRLLPLLALVVVAIAAVPFLLSEGGRSASRILPPPSSGAVLRTGGGGSHFAVVRLEPGLGVPNKRLANRAPKNPFRKQPVPTVLKPGSEPITHTTTTTTNTTTSPSKTATPNPSGSGPVTTHITYFAPGIDVKITRSENGKKPETTTRDRVVAPTALPDSKTPVVVFIAIGKKTKNPIFLVSDEVTGVFGEAQCVVGSSSCQLLEIEPGFPETFVYGHAGVRYKIDVLKTGIVITGHS